jgi:hypothetical protein
VSSPWTFKEGLSGGGPPDLCGRRRSPRPKRASMKGCVNGSAGMPKPKGKTADLSRRVELSASAVMEN